MAEKHWTYAEITEATEQQIKMSMELAVDSSKDAAQCYRMMASGCYFAWAAITSGYQKPGDAKRLSAMSEAK
jgi:hypothetical protein